MLTTARQRRPWPTSKQLPSRFLTEHVEAQRAFALAEQLSSINAAAARVGHHLAVIRGCGAHLAPFQLEIGRRPSCTSGPP